MVYREFPTRWIKAHLGWLNIFERGCFRLSGSAILFFNYLNLQKAGGGLCSSRGKLSKSRQSDPIVRSMEGLELTQDLFSAQNFSVLAVQVRK
jgi:hypothetical protein